MNKELNLSRAVYELVKESPELQEILAELPYLFSSVLTLLLVFAFKPGLHAPILGASSSQAPYRLALPFGRVSLRCLSSPTRF